MTLIRFVAFDGTYPKLHALSRYDDDTRGYPQIPRYMFITALSICKIHKTLKQPFDFDFEEGLKINEKIYDTSWKNRQLLNTH